MSNSNPFRGDRIDAEVYLSTSEGAVDLTGYSVEAMIRSKTSTGNGTLLASWTTEILDQTDTATKGRIALSLDAATTAGLPVNAVLQYDIQITDPDGNPTTIGPCELMLQPDQTHA